VTSPRHPRRTRILVVGHAQSPTGFGRVLHSLLPHLAAKYDVHHLGHNYHGEPLDGAWHIHPNAEPIDVFGLATLQRLIEQLDPELVLLLHDPWNIARYASALRAIRHRARIVAYTPIDARLLSPQHLAWIPWVDKVVTYTAFGQRTIESCLNPLGIQADIAVIPHGTNTEAFYPYSGPPGAGESRVQARRELRPLVDIPEDSFVVLNASRNQPRKRIDLTMAGFALFARTKPPEVRLMLHMGGKEIGWNIRSLAAEAGILDRTILTATANGHPEFSDRVLNLIYNSSDVGVNTAAAEAWGLASFEHAATGAPQIVPGYGGCAEIWNGHAALLEPVQRQRLGHALEASIVSPEQLANELEALYVSPAHRRDMGMAAYAHATKPEYNWATVAGMWSELFEQLTACNTDRSTTSAYC
jgi:D-inositol-3-phosphate glycosyltransferase